jgi:xylulokinase
MSNDRFVLAVDLGTTSCKTILLDDAGAIRHQAAREYPLVLPQPGWAEQEPQTWWRAVAESIRQVAGCIDPAAVQAIGLSGQMHGLVLLDDRAEVLRPAILWNDQRSAPQCQAIYEAAGGPQGLLAHTNNAMLPGYTGGKILWVREHEPEVYRRIAHLLLPKDYIRWRLCGQIATDDSDASGTGLFDVRKRRWAGALLDRLEIPHGWFPRVLPAAEVAGRLQAGTAAELGLPTGLPVIAGGGDAVVQTVGSGAVDSDTVLVVIGTGGNVTVSLPDCTPNPEGRLQSFCHVLPDQWVAMGVTVTAGSSLRWFRDTLGGPEILLARDLAVDPYELLGREAATSPPGAGGLLFLPYLQGERCPHPDAHLRGAFLGLGLHTRKADLVRSILEGVAFSLRDVLELILSTGIRPKSVIASGGGAASPLWRRVLADVFGREVATLEHSADAGAVGAAILAGIPAGFWPSAKEAVARIPRRTLDRPVEVNAALYDRLFELYRKQYPALKPTFDELSALRGA